MITPRVEMIWAQSTDTHPVIGTGGLLPWHLPEDLSRFQALTSGHVVIMGRKTWESLPVRPLGNRINVVMTHGDKPALEGALTSDNLLDAIQTYGVNCRKVIVIGGYELFTSAMQYATKLHVTEVDLKVMSQNVDVAYAPVIDGKLWSRSETSPWALSLKPGLLYRYLCFVRR